MWKNCFPDAEAMLDPNSLTRARYQRFRLGVSIADGTLDIVKEGEAPVS